MVTTTRKLQQPTLDFLQSPKVALDFLLRHELRNNQDRRSYNKEVVAIRICRLDYLLYEVFHTLDMCERPLGLLINSPSRLMSGGIWKLLKPHATPDLPPDTLLFSHRATDRAVVLRVSGHLGAKLFDRAYSWHERNNLRRRKPEISTWALAWR